MRLMYLALLILLVKVSLVVSEDLEQCVPGFSEQRYAFTVPRKILEKGRAVGKVTFTSCSVNNRALYSPEDTRFRVFPDGKVAVKRQITLHDGAVSFVLNAWDAKGTRHSVPIILWNERQQQAQSSDGNKVIEKTSPLLTRKKRGWIIPPVIIPENEWGPYPKRIVQVKWAVDSTPKVSYSLSGPGADSDPLGLFTIDSAGWLKVSRPLDRENNAKYNVKVTALSESGQTLAGPLDVFIKVSDQNDNSPVFTQAHYDGGIKEDALPGTSVVKVLATDEDDTEFTSNGIVQYSITAQTPDEPNNMFRIDPKTGLISVDKLGLSYKKNKKYDLTVSAADMEGLGLSTTCKVVISVLPAEGDQDMSGGSDSLLSTHVLNTAQGIPAKGLTITLSKLDASKTKWAQVSRSVTNEDGRCPGLLRGEPLTAGTFQLRFDTKDYWKQLQQDSFYPYVEVVFTISDPKQKYHVPLLLTPFSYTTYRGS
ncbi:blastomere cadherin-like isoform X2 [Dendrobates tinctorius]|uniref:blastomere cadherin-like isoform X2 n=1 Tax=Dendrobates tinctorius TaxID=92724 RepID=UPI003CCA4B38